MYGTMTKKHFVPYLSIPDFIRNMLPSPHLIFASTSLQTTLYLKITIVRGLDVPIPRMSCPSTTTEACTVFVLGKRPFGCLLRRKRKLRRAPLSNGAELEASPVECNEHGESNRSSNSPGLIQTMCTVSSITMVSNRRRVSREIAAPDPGISKVQDVGGADISNAGYLEDRAVKHAWR